MWKWMDYVMTLWCNWLLCTVFWKECLFNARTKEETTVDNSENRKRKPTQITKIQLENRFDSLYQDLASFLSTNKERYETKSKSRRPQTELITGPQTLIVGDLAAKSCLPPSQQQEHQSTVLPTIWSLISQKKHLEIVVESSNSEISHLTHRGLWCCEATFWGIETRLHWSVEQNLSILWCFQWPSDCPKRWWEIQ